MLDASPSCLVIVLASFAWNLPVVNDGWGSRTIGTGGSLALRFSLEPLILGTVVAQSALLSSSSGTSCGRTQAIAEVTSFALVTVTTASITIVVACLALDLEEGTLQDIGASLDDSSDARLCLRILNRTLLTRDTSFALIGGCATTSTQAIVARSASNTVSLFRKTFEWTVLTRVATSWGRCSLLAVETSGAARPCNFISWLRALRA